MKDSGARTRGMAKATKSFPIKTSTLVTMSKEDLTEKVRGSGQRPMRCMRGSGTKACDTGLATGHRNIAIVSHTCKAIICGRLNLTIIQGAL